MKVVTVTVSAPLLLGLGRSQAARKALQAIERLAGKQPNYETRSSPG